MCIHTVSMPLYACMSTSRPQHLHVFERIVTSHAPDICIWSMYVSVVHVESEGGYCGDVVMW